jgi:ABC-type xylose transport system permease subunit
LATLRRRWLKFSVIVLACMAAGAVFGQWAGLVANVFTFIALVVYLFDVEPLDATILWLFTSSSTSPHARAAAVFARDTCRGVTPAAVAIGATSVTVTVTATAGRWRVAEDVQQRQRDRHHTGPDHQPQAR